MKKNLKKIATAVLDESDGYIEGTDIPVDSVAGARILGKDDDTRPKNQEEFVRMSNEAMAQGYMGIDTDGNPCNDPLKVDTIGPDLWKAMNED